MGFVVSVDYGIVVVVVITIMDLSEDDEPDLLEDDEPEEITVGPQIDGYVIHNDRCTLPMEHLRYLSTKRCQGVATKHSMKPLLDDWYLGHCFVTTTMPITPVTASLQAADTTT